MEIAESTQKTKEVASSLLLEEVVQDPKDKRYGTGEDPQVLAEALGAGAQWVASDNLWTISIDAMNRRLEKQQAMGNYLEVPQPFILRPDEAVITLLRASRQDLMKDPWTADTAQVALCAAICESADEDEALERRVWNLGRFAHGTTEGGAALKRRPCYVPEREGDETGSMPSVGQRLQSLKSAPSHASARAGRRGASPRAREFPPDRVSCAHAPAPGIGRRCMSGR